VNRHALVAASSSASAQGLLSPHLAGTPPVRPRFPLV
jgi:hypothetical protein